MMATDMDTSSIGWLSELEIDEYSIIHQYHVNSFVGAELEAAQETIRQSFSMLDTTNYNDSSYDVIEEKPSKHLKIDQISPKLPSPPPCSPKNLPSSRMLSFENFDSNTNDSANYLNSIVSLKDKAASPNGNNVLEKGLPITSRNQKGTKRAHLMTRSRSHAQDHIVAERKRREKLSQRFIALSAMVPGLKKMDKASVLGDAIKHIKHLQERVREFEKQMKKRTVESVVLVKKSQLFPDDQFSYSDENSGLPEIEARVSDKDVLIKIHCEKQKGHATRILAEIEQLRLSIINSSVLPFGATLDMTVVAQKEGDFDMTLVDIVKNLRLALSKFM